MFLFAFDTLNFIYKSITTKESAEGYNEWNFHKQDEGKKLLHQILEAEQITWKKHYKRKKVKFLY